MRDLFRETFVGQALRVLSGGRLLSYPDAHHGLPPYSIRDKSKGKAEDGDDKFLVTWYGPDDVENPQNWSLFKKVFVSGLICFLTFGIYIGSAIYTPGEQGIMEQFEVSQTMATLGLTLFVFGYGFGPMFLAPFSEAPPIGRMPVYMITLIMFVFMNFGIIYATNISMLLAFRFLTGFIGSPVLATGGASLADMWSPVTRGYAIAVWGLFAVLGPVIGPLLGGFAVEHEGWTWSVWELIWLSGACCVVLLFTLPETGSATILYRRAQRIREATGIEHYRSPGELELADVDMKQMAIAILWRPFQLCFQEPILLATNAYLGLIYALLYIWFEAFEIVFVEIYSFDLGQIGLAFLGIPVGAIIITAPYMIWLRYWQSTQFDDQGNIAPEKRLPPAIVGSFFIPVCAFWFGFSSRPSVHWIMPIIGSAFFPMGAVLLFNAILNYQGDAYPQYVGSVFAGNDLIRCLFGGAFPLFATAMFRTLGVDWGCALLGFLSIAFIPIPILLSVYGKRIRMASKYARHDI